MDASDQTDNSRILNDEQEQALETDFLLHRSEQHSPRPFYYNRLFITVFIILAFILILIPLITTKLVIPMKINQALRDGQPPNINSVSILNMSEERLFLHIDMNLPVQQSPISVNVKQQLMELSSAEDLIASFTFPEINIFAGDTNKSISTQIEANLNTKYLSNFLTSIVNDRKDSIAISLHSNPLVSLVIPEMDFISQYLRDFVGNLDKETVLDLKSSGSGFNSSVFNATVPLDTLKIINESAVEGIMVYKNPYPYSFKQKLNISADFWCSFAQEEATKVLNVYAKNTLFLESDNKQYWKAVSQNYLMLTKCFENYSDGKKTWIKITGIKVEAAEGWKWINELVRNWEISFWVDGAKERSVFKSLWHILGLKLLCAKIGKVC